MADKTENQSPVYLYETLTPLSLTATAPSTPDHRPLPSDNGLDPYSVLRNEISLSTLHDSLDSEIAATDFFSLNVEEHEPVTPVQTAAEPVTPVRRSEPRLESALWFRGNNKFKSPMLQLHKEIVDFCDFLSPTPDEQASRNMAVESVFGVIRYIWPNAKVEVFGSFKTDLYLPTSDIDVVILDSGIRTPQSGVHALSRALSQKGIAKKIQVIAKARVPIVKFVEKRSGFSFDVSFDLQNGPAAAEFIKDAVSTWPPLRPLCLILKVFLQQRELNEVYSGGIGSYALLAMLMGMLKGVRESRRNPEHNLGVLLVHFFDIYGRKLNTTDVGIACNGSGIFFSKSSKGFMNKERPFLISIEDPQAPENDIGKNSFNYFQIRSAFGMAFATLTNTKTILGLGPNRSILGTIIRPDPVLLERRGGSNGVTTFNSLLPGAGEPIDNGDYKEILCNWLLEDEEEPLPRSVSVVENGTLSSRKKRKSSSHEKSKKKKKKEKPEDSSIPGTIIRPDPVLLERRGGSNGETTFNSLLPGAGERSSSNSRSEKSPKKKRPRRRNNYNNNAHRPDQYVAGSPA